MQLLGGETKQVTFDGLEGAVIFMLGDGVNEYLNVKEDLPCAPCHSLTMPAMESVVRSWYGRIASPLKRKRTAGALRRLVGSATSSDDASILRLGCSGRMYARELSESDAMWCWHRCME